MLSWSNRGLCGVLTGLLLWVPMAGRLQSETRSAAEGVPLIERELLLADPEISSAQLSPDGHSIAFLQQWHGILNIYVKSLRAANSDSWRITSESRRPISSFFWSRDSRFILFARDQDGDENYNVYAVDPTRPVTESGSTSTGRNLTNLNHAHVVLYDVPESQPDIIYIGINARDKAWHDLYSLNLETGNKSLVLENRDRIQNWVFDQQGRLRLAVRSADNGDTELLRAEGASLARVTSCAIDEICRPLHFASNGDLYMESNHGADRSALVLIDLLTGRSQIVDQDPRRRVDLGGALFSPRDGQLEQTWYVDRRVRVYYKAHAFWADNRWLAKRYHGYEIHIVSRSSDDQLWLVTVDSDTEPGRTFLYNRSNHQITEQFSLWSNIPRDRFASMRSVRYRSSDGLLIPAFLTLPVGVPPKGLPAIILPHGGPWSRDRWGFNPLVQFLANRGYAVLSPNYRGSTGYGKAFLNAGNREWGRKMQDDLTWGAKYLVSHGIANPQRIGIVGGSYGGFAVLAGLAFTPGVYAAGVDLAGPSNLLTLLGELPSHWEPMRKLYYLRIGDPESANGREVLAQQSPVNQAGSMRAPLLIVQGARDPRVTRSEGEQIATALRLRGMPVEYLLIPNEGHGFARPDNRLAVYMEIEQFLAKYLGGRSQQNSTAEERRKVNEFESQTDANRANH